MYYWITEYGAQCVDRLALVHSAEPHEAGSQASPRSRWATMIEVVLLEASTKLPSAYSVLDKCVKRVSPEVLRFDVLCCAWFPRDSEIGDVAMDDWQCLCASRNVLWLVYSRHLCTSHSPLPTFKGFTLPHSRVRRALNSTLLRTPSLKSYDTISL